MPRWPSLAQKVTSMEEGTVHSGTDFKTISEKKKKTYECLLDKRSGTDLDV